MAVTAPASERMPVLLPLPLAGPYTYRMPPALGARPGDFVYFDPPYVPVSKTAFFTGYSKGGFGPADQERLRDVFQELERRGCFVMLSNSGSRVVRKLYAGYDIVTIPARRAINSKVTARGPVDEVVVRSYE